MECRYEIVDINTTLRRGHQTFTKSIQSINIEIFFNTLQAILTGTMQLNEEIAAKWRDIRVYIYIHIYNYIFININKYKYIFRNINIYLYTILYNIFIYMYMDMYIYRSRYKSIS